MSEKSFDFSYSNDVVQISLEEPFLTREIDPQSMAIYFLLGSTLLEIQSFENHLSFLLSALEIMDIRVRPPQTIDEAIAKLREKNSRLTLGQLLTKISVRVDNEPLLDELHNIKLERNQLVHHFWRVLDWPFQDQAGIKREFELAEHLRVRMIYGQVALANYIQSKDSRIKFHFGVIDPKSKKITLEDGSEATRTKE